MNVELKNAIIAAGQGELLKFWDDLTEAEKSAFAGELAAVDWAQIPRLAAEYVLKRPEMAIPDDLTPAEFFPLAPATEAQAELYRRAEAKGIELLKNGKVCCLTVAGGQGTRLGFDGPKGT